MAAVPEFERVRPSAAPVLSLSGAYGAKWTEGSTQSISIRTLVPKPLHTFRRDALAFMELHISAMTLALPDIVVQPVPRHIAVIMDGNGRWANARKKPRQFGHKAGVEALRRTVQSAAELGITYLTVFGFSTENWRRPVAEIEALFDLMRLYVDRDLDRLAREGVRIRIIGERVNLPTDLEKLIQRAEDRTAQNSRFYLTIAFNYGGQAEIVRAAQRIAQAALHQTLAISDINSDLFRSFLDTKDLPDPDLLIRTSGEQRMSNFLIWQAAYAELIFLDVFWPDFDRAHLVDAIAQFQRRDRRFGASQ